MYEGAKEKWPRRRRRENHQSPCRSFIALSRFAFAGLLNKRMSAVYCFVPGVKLASIRMLRAAALPLKLNDSIILTDEQFLEHLKT